MDMSKSYRAAFEEYLPEIDIVFDRFHVMQIVNKAVESVRKNQQKALDKEGIKTLKGGRFLPLWNFENLNPLKQERLKYMLEANEPLFIIHSMKEQLRLLWNQPNEEKAIVEIRKKVVLRFLQDIPAIIGSDMKTYGPFLAEDVGSLPDENAKILVRQGLAKLVEST